jgi:hypothetical protein
MVITSIICPFVKPAAMKEANSCSLKCPRFSMSVFARGGKCGKSLGCRYAPLTNRVGLFGADPLLERQPGMERDCICAGVRDCVCQKNDLVPLLSEAPAVDLLKSAHEELTRLGELAMAPAMFGTTPKAYCDKIRSRRWNSRGIPHANALMSDRSGRRSSYPASNRFVDCLHRRQSEVVGG